MYLHDEQGYIQAEGNYNCRDGLHPKRDKNKPQGYFISMTKDIHMNIVRKTASICESPENIRMKAN